VLRARIWPAVGDVAVSLEHVGSTSVPGLAAKPIIDLVVVVASRADVSTAIRRLGGLGYTHQGDLGIEGREALDSPKGGALRHHLYCAPVGNVSLTNQVRFRDYLRTHPETAKAYGTLKQKLATAFADDIDGYSRGKTSFILGVLREAGFSAEQLDAIARMNE
jgi:GrpB-like predicted nucleotidyltransferase (UPF0157 family)